MTNGREELTADMEKIADGVTALASMEGERRRERI
jgi:hypothetical protein